MKMIRQIIGCIALGTVLAAASVDAQTLVQSGTGIGVNFVGNNNEDAKKWVLESTHSAGYVPLTNWNNIGNFKWGVGTTTRDGLHDSSNSNVGLSVSITGTTEGFQSLEGSVSFTNTTYPGDNLLFKGILVDYYGYNTTIKLSNISYAMYDLIVYLGPASYDTSTAHTGNIKIGNTTYYYGSAYTATRMDQWLTSTATTLGAATPANYMVFSGLTGDSQTIIQQATGSYQGKYLSGIAGFQLIEYVTQVPEPSTLVLLGGSLVLLAVLKLRRRDSRNS